MKIIKKPRQTGRTTELIKYCIENHRNGKINLPYLFVVDTVREKERIEYGWSDAINACFFQVKTFDECAKNPNVVKSKNWSGVVIDNLDSCLIKYFGKVDLITTL